MIVSDIQCKTCKLVFVNKLNNKMSNFFVVEYNIKTLSLGFASLDITYSVEYIGYPTQHQRINMLSYETIKTKPYLTRQRLQ